MLSLTVAQARLIIAELEDTFDSHDFIMKYIRYSRQTEREYVQDLYAAIDSPNGIFRSYHSQLARFLSEHSGALEIEKMERDNSMNIKDYDSSNMYWRKTGA